MTIFSSFFRFSLLALSVVFVVACNPAKRINRDINYFQRGFDSLGVATYKEPLIQSNDLLSIQVFSGTISQDQAMLFNIPNGGGSSGSGSSASGSTTAGGGYQVDSAGNIQMPIVGFISAKGLTRQQLSISIAQKLQDYVKQPNVMVRFARFRINVLGEVKIPGPKDFTTDRATLTDAISMAGDLTEAGKREDIMVIREENGVRKVYHVDVRTAAVFQSPVYQLQQNDLIVVSANDTKLKMLKTNPNLQRDLSIGLSVISVLALIVNTVAILRR